MTVQEVSFRRWIPHDEAFLWEMLYQSLHVPKGSRPYPRSVLDKPEIAHYLTGFGSRLGDDAEVCLDGGGTPVGAAWCRRLPAEDPGYGFVAEDIPEVGMAVVASRRGRGIGRYLLEALLLRHPVMSLSVDDDNGLAAALYMRLGFVPIGSDATSTIMLRS